MSAELERMANKLVEDFQLDEGIGIGEETEIALRDAIAEALRQVAERCWEIHDRSDFGQLAQDKIKKEFGLNVS